MEPIKSLEEAMLILDHFAGCEERQARIGPEWNCIGDKCAIFKRIPSGDCGQVCGAAARYAKRVYDAGQAAKQKEE